MPESMSMMEAVAAGHRALTRGSWAEARSWFDSVLERGDDPAALEGLSWTHWWQEDLQACLAARERAYRGYRARGDARSAARMALWIGDDHLWYRGAPALAAGWFGRARRLLADLPECPEHGWQAVFDAHVALADDDVAAARRLAGEAERIGRDFGVIGLEMFAVATDGVACVEQGEVVAGMQRLDEASAAALSGEYEDLAPAAWSCCLLLTACEEQRDLERGAQWCQQIDAFSRRIGAPFVLGNCRSHQGSILARQGHWGEAERELEAAARALATGPALWYGDALARLGDLRRRQGRHAEARRLLEQAGEQWLAQAGLAALCLEDGDVDGAVALADRALRQLPSGSPRRVEALEVAVRGRLARGDVDTATSHVAELRSLAEDAGTALLLATVKLSESRLAAALDDADTAIERADAAVAGFEQVGAPLEEAQARMQLAEALASTDKGRLAQAEARRARASLTGLGLAHRAGDAQSLAGDVAHDQPLDSPNGVLTPRQVEVLRLAAEGFTQREIAEQLVVSEHTIHRHLANIYRRLDCSSRAGAITRAGRLGLL